MSYAVALEIARAEFERFLAQVGVTATWKQRTSAVPNSTGAISQTTGRGDPVDTAFVLEPSNTALYTNKGSILVAKDTPFRQGTAAGAVVLAEGMSLAHCAIGDAVEVGDILEIAGQVWYVEAVSVPSPPLWRELTLQLRRP